MELISIMTDNFNVNDNMYTGNSTVEEYNKYPGGNMEPFYEEITVMKTEVKEELYDFEMSVDEMESMNAKEELIFKEENLELVTNEESTFSPQIVFEQDNLGLVKNTEQSLNENLVVGNYQINEVDLQNNKYRCHLCHSEFGEEVYLRSHYEQCVLPAKKTLFECKHPGETASLKQHLLMKHSTQAKKYKCSNCQYVTHSKSRLVVHTNIHNDKKLLKCTYKNCTCTPGQEEFCVCNVCQYTFASITGLNQHILTKHSTEPKKYKCSHCKFATHYQSHLTNHEVIHNSTKPKKYKCSHCKYATHFKSSLTKHENIHSGEKTFKCTYKNCKCTPGQEELCECNTCEYAYANKSNLKKHILHKHSAEPKKYECSNCQYTTHSKAYLAVHNRLHTGENLYLCTYKNCRCTPGQEEFCKCNICEHVYATRGGLKQHILTKHSLEPTKYKCTYKDCKCTPSQETACECNMCDFETISIYTLKRHVLKKHEAESKQ